MKPMEIEQAFIEGVEHMKNKMLLACKSGKPIEINGRAYFIVDDIKHLQILMDKLENNYNQNV